MFKTSRSIDELAGGLRWTKVFFSVFLEGRKNEPEKPTRKKGGEGGRTSPRKK